MIFKFFLLLIAVSTLSIAKESSQVDEASQLFTIEGTASLRQDMKVPNNWQTNSKVLIDHGKYIGFITWVSLQTAYLHLIFSEDGSFQVQGVPSGSYIVEISNTDYIFEPVRVDITSSGKMRARKLNLLQVCKFSAANFKEHLKFAYLNIRFFLAKPSKPNSISATDGCSSTNEILSRSWGMANVCFEVTLFS